MRNSKLIWIGVLLFVAAIIVGAVGGIYIVREIPLIPPDRFVAPGELDFHVDEPGDYRITYEHDSVIDGRTYSTSSRPPSIACTVTDPDGRQITLSETFGEMTYSTPSTEGIDLLSFQTSQSGVHQLTVEQTGPGADAGFVIAVGPAAIGDFLIALFSTICSGSLLALVGIVFIIVGIVRKATQSSSAPAHPIT